MPEATADGPTADGAPALRLVDTLLFVARRGEVRTREVAAHTGISPRRAREDLRRLAARGLVEPLGEGRARRWRVVDAASVRPLGLLDRIALELGREVAAFLRGTALAEGIENFAPARGVPPRFARHLDRKFRLLREPYRNYADCGDTMDAVLDALLRERRLSFGYVTADGSHRRFRRFEPLTLVVYRRAVYLLGRAGRGVRRLAIERMRDVEVGEDFAYPEDWDPDEELAAGFGIFASGGRRERVVLRFSARVAPFVRARSWHPTGTLEDLEDGGVELRMRAGGRELVRFALEWGEHCEVVRPSWLREAVIAELKGALARYGEGS